MATSRKLQQGTSIFTEESISRNSFYILMIVCLGYFMHTNTFTALVDKLPTTSESTDVGSEGPKARKVKIATAGMGGFFETRKGLNEKTKASGIKINEVANHRSSAIFKDEVIGNTKLVQAYIKRYAAVAKIEELEMAIPASITLAQGILESGAGTTKSAQLVNNHFSKTCHLKNCKKNHCKNIVPDARKDFFIIYQNAWQSYRAHSESLYREDRFQKLYSIPKKDYRSWAKGLEKAGYSKDKNYAAKLIYLIETYRLNKI